MYALQGQGFIEKIQGLSSASLLCIFTEGLRFQRRLGGGVAFAGEDDVGFHLPWVMT